MLSVGLGIEQRCHLAPTELCRSYRVSNCFGEKGAKFRYFTVDDAKAFILLFFIYRSQPITTVVVVYRRLDWQISMKLFGWRKTRHCLRVESGANSLNFTLGKMRSKTWLHFVKIDSNTVKCNRCLAIIKCKSGNTSNMMKHLITHGINLRLDTCTVFNTPSAGSSATTDEITGTFPARS